jgi:Cu(I)/Ag(I) efflux system membrane fusion protein
MGEAQIREIGNTRQAVRDIDVVSPVTGVIFARKLSPGQRLERGTEIYRIVDLSTVWIAVSVSPEEMASLKPGTMARVVERRTGAVLNAMISSTFLMFDRESRLPWLKLEAHNAGLVLRPDMYVDVEFETSHPTGITVPKEAVLDKGREKIVFVQRVQRDDQLFEPRVVKVGEELGDRVVVKSGLSKGEKVVVSSNFLLDSESRLGGREFARGSHTLTRTRTSVLNSLQ